MYRTQQQEFPPECSKTRLRRTVLKAAYPIHPEVFDRLYNDWSTLVKFQRTRGVLRLMASVIHSLWEKGDRNPLILPSNIPIDDRRVENELTRYLSDNWVPVIEKDVDGAELVAAAGSTAKCRILESIPRRGALREPSISGSAPTMTAANRGLEDRRDQTRLCHAGRIAAVFGDALRRLAATATYLYQDGPRYWYSTQPTVTKLADDRAEQLKRDADKVVQEIDRPRESGCQKNRRLQPGPSLARHPVTKCRMIWTQGWS